MCEGECTPGYYCPAGSTTNDAVTCGGASFYCGVGDGAPTSVSTGYYSVGPAGTDAPDDGDAQHRTGQRPCEAGWYCVGGVRTQCAAGTYGGSSGLSSAQQCLPCSAGFYGATAGRTQAKCSGPCPAGMYCPTGTVTPLACNAGRWGAAGTDDGGGQVTGDCSGPCPAAYVLRRPALMQCQAAPALICALAVMHVLRQVLLCRRDTRGSQAG